MNSTFLKVVQNWTNEELNTFRRMMFVDQTSINDICKHFAAKSRQDCQVIHEGFIDRDPCGNRSPWNKESDAMLVDAMNKWESFQPMNRFWQLIASCVFGRSAKQCRERWNNQLSPNLSKAKWSKEEQERLIAAVERYGNQWAAIQRAHFPNRSPNYLKNQYNRVLRHEKRGTKRKRYSSDPEEESDEALLMDSNEELSTVDSDDAQSPSSSSSSRKYVTRSQVKESALSTKQDYRMTINTIIIPEPQRLAQTTFTLCDENPRPTKIAKVTLDHPLFYMIACEEFGMPIVVS